MSAVRRRYAEATAPSASPVEVRYVWATALVALVVILLPWLPFVSFSIIGRANLAAQYALVALSLVVLTGWVGQVSLGQAAFVGVGAYLTGIAQEGWGIGFPLNLAVGAIFGALVAAALGTVALRVRGLYLAVATLIFSWTADSFLFQQEWLTRHSFISLEPIGDPGTVPFLDFTSRRTYYYAAWATVLLAIFLMANLRDRKIGRAFFAIRGSEMAAASLGIDVVRTKLTAFAVSGALAGIAGSLTLVAGQIVTQDQFSLSRSLFFLAVAVVGGLSSLGGAVASGALFAGLEEVFFRIPSIGNYLQLVTATLLAAVLLLYPGGLGAFGHALERWARTLYRRWYPGEETELAAARSSDRPEGVDAEAPEVEGADAEAPEVEGARRIPVPRWISPLVGRFQGYFDRIFAAQEAKRKVREAATFLDFSAALDPESEHENGHASADRQVDEPVGPGAAKANGADDPADNAEEDDRDLSTWETMEFQTDPVDPSQRQERPVLIEARHITVRFGGLTAVNDVSLKIHQGEIVGLIGPNGAGKTTLFNSIAGFNTPTEGQVFLHGVDVTGLPVYLRSRLGVARTFQAIQLFPQLNVFDNLLVATYISDEAGLFGSMLASNRSLEEESAARDRVNEVIELLGLDDVADRQVSELPFGVLRMVEVARALVTGAPVIMLDEPASGLDDVETARLSQLIRFIRSLGVTVLLIEHDVQMVTGISDYMYVIDQGTPIAEGVPSDIQRNHAVISAYLGGADEDEEEAAEAEEILDAASVRS